MEQNSILDEVKGDLIKALAVTFMQEISVEDIAKEMVKIATGTSTPSEEKPKTKEKVDFADVPVHWNEIKMTDKRQKKATGRWVVLSDGLRKEGFLSLTLASEFLGNHPGYLRQCINTGRKIMSYPDAKEWFVYEIEEE